MVFISAEAVRPHYLNLIQINVVFTRNSIVKHITHDAVQRITPIRESKMQHNLK